MISASLASVLLLAAALPLASLQWQSRVVLVFGAGDEAKRQTEILLRDKEALADRDLVVVEVAREATALFGRSRSPLPTAEEFRAHYRVGEGEFIALLVGKDGGEKLRVDRPAPLSAFVDLIDTMPMRRREMNDRAD